MPFSRFVLLMILAGCWGGLAAAFPLPRPDRYGDPLPAGAVSRLGTIQLRAGCRELSFSADGRTLIGVDRFRVSIWDPATGGLLASRALPTDGSARAQRAEDGRTSVMFGPLSLRLCDLPSGKQINLPELRGFVSPEWAAVSNDRRWILLADTDKLPAPVQGMVMETQSLQHLVLLDIPAKTART